MAQLVERSLPTPVANVIYYQLYSKDENKEKEAASDPFINTLMLNFFNVINNLHTYFQFSVCDFCMKCSIYSWLM